MTTHAVLFDDAAGGLSPLNDLRPTCAVRTGALTTFERHEASLGVRIVAIDVLPEHVGLCDCGDAVVTSGDGADRFAAAGFEPGQPVLAINAACSLPLDEIGALKTGHSLIEQASGRVVAFCDSADNLAAHIADARRAAGGDRWSGLPAQTIDERAIMSRPWHWRTFRDACIAHDLRLVAARLRATGRHAIVEDLAGVLVLTHAPGSMGTAAPGHEVTVAASAKVWPGVVLDASGGPIVIDEDAAVRPGATIIGPVYLGPKSTVLDKTLVKGGTAIGPVCKVAGEVGGVVMQGYANKAHDGHLGDAWLGEWVNLGAGTTNSNLLNTYGEVVAQAEPGGRRERTGETYLGCTLGDHVKTAICTRIMTGAIAHTGVMWATTAPLAGTVGRFRWVTDSMGPEGKPYRFEKFIDVARTVAGRRDVTLSDAYEHRTRELADG